jgi:hypothetical protein
VHFQAGVEKLRRAIHLSCNPHSGKVFTKSLLLKDLGILFNLCSRRIKPRRGIIKMS